MKLVLAGGESWWDYFRDRGIRYILLSYHYLRTQKDFSKMVAWMREAKDRGHPDGPYHFMLDSGAFTFQGNKPRSALGEELEAYADEYIRFLEHDPCVDLFDNVAELDVYERPDGYHDPERVAGWRDRIHDAVGRRCMPVVHPWHAPEEYTALMTDDRFDWVGIASGLSGEMGQQKLLIALGHRHGKKVHGFGMTRLQTDMMYLRNYDSVDSSTWLRADKYGGTFIFHRGFLRILNHLQKDQRAFFKGYFRQIGLDPARILGTHRDHAEHCPGPNSQTPECEACKDQLEELRASSLIAWRKLAIYYDRMGIRREQHGRMRAPPHWGNPGNVRRPR